MSKLTERVTSLFRRPRPVTPDDADRIANWVNEGGAVDRKVRRRSSATGARPRGSDRRAEEGAARVQHEVKVRRAYDEQTANDGMRVLVDRLWPRGLSKDRAQLDEWCKDVAPSPELRKWYAHDPDRFAEFASRYEAELKEPPRAEALRHLRTLAEQGSLTLLTAAKRDDFSEAAVLAGLLNS